MTIFFASGDVSTVCYGMAASMGAFLLGAGGSFDGRFHCKLLTFRGADQKNHTTSLRWKLKNTHRPRKRGKEEMKTT